MTTTPTRIDEVNGRYHVFATIDGQERQIADAKTLSGAQRAAANRDENIVRARSSRSASHQQDLADENAAWDRYNTLRPRMRKTVSREPGYSVASLMDRCEAVLAYWGAPVRTCIVLMADGASNHGTYPLDEQDEENCQLELGCY